MRFNVCKCNRKDDSERPYVRSCGYLCYVWRGNNIHILVFDVGI